MTKILISIVIVALIVAGVYLLANSSEPQDIGQNINNKSIKIVTSLEDQISDNSAWCGTFNLIWNDLKNDLAKQDIKFADNSNAVDNLNRGTFTVNDLSEDSYYKTYGRPTLELKAEIERAIKEKFDETSDILDDFNWGAAGEKDYFLYSMLKKKFEYPKEFTKLENGKFGQYNSVRYFGINNKTKKEVREQIDVLYYNSEDDFALKIKTKGNDEVIVSVGNKENNFLDIYNAIMNESENYIDGKSLRNNDIFKMPYITFDLKEEITEVENKPFYFSNGDTYVIDKALQTIQFEIDEKGGEIKSEAGMLAKATSTMPKEPRKFNVDQTFTIFLIEQDRALPYFAAKISDISSVQVDVINNENEGNSTSAYIPEEMPVDSNDDADIKTEDIIINRDREKVTIEVLMDAVTRNGATVVITDKNETSYGWGKSYKLQQKIDDSWYDIVPQNEMIFEEIAYILDANGQFTENIDWTSFYGELSDGTYRIVKNTYDNGYIDFYSNEFEIR